MINPSKSYILHMGKTNLLLWNDLDMLQSFLVSLNCKWLNYPKMKINNIPFPLAFYDRHLSIRSNKIMDEISPGVYEIMPW